MAISGQKSHKSFLRYIKVSGDEFADKLENLCCKGVEGVLELGINTE